jgi:transcriptional regulator with GAF, ATPase, and Fis domain
MNQKSLLVRRLLAVLTCALISTTASAQTVQVHGVIDGRSGEKIMLKSADGTNVTVVLSDTTQVEELEGGLHMRKKEMGLTALIPGLPVEIQGTYDAQHQLAANSVKFKASDLQRAQDMQASMVPLVAQQQAQQQQLAAQQAKLQQEQQALTAQQQQQAADEAKIAADKAAIAATNKRFSELGDYNVISEVTVLFANGKVLLEPQYKPQFLQLAQKAKTVDG